MKTRSRIFSILLALLFLLSLSCRKKEKSGPELPNGPNTIYYYVNDTLVIPKTIRSVDGTLYPVNIFHCGQGGPGEGSYMLTTSTHLYIFFKDGVNSTGTITLYQSHYDMCRLPYSHAFLGVKQWDPDGVQRTYEWYTHDGTGRVNITWISDDKQRFKGTFEMDVYHRVTGEVKHITGGHFNIDLEKLRNR